MLSPSPGIKGQGNAVGINPNNELSNDQNTTNNPSPSVGGSSYNVTRVKYQVKQPNTNSQ